MHPSPDLPVLKCGTQEIRYEPVEGTARLPVLAVCAGLGIDAAKELRRIAHDPELAAAFREGCIGFGPSFTWIMRIRQRNPAVFALQHQVCAILYDAFGGGRRHSALTALLAPTDNLN